MIDLKENMVNFEQGHYSTQLFIDKEILSWVLEAICYITLCGAA